MSVPILEQIACVKREIAMRERVYPNFITKGRMTPERAKYETETMQAVLETLEEMKAIQEVGAEFFGR